MSNKTKTVSKKNATRALVELAMQAKEFEDARNWSDAARVWQRIASHKSASRKMRAEARRCVEAARARAQSKITGAEVALATTSTSCPLESGSIGIAPPLVAVQAPAHTIESNTKEAIVVTRAHEDRKRSQPRKARLPAIGTTIQKRNREGEIRCECKVVDGGLEYRGTTYKSLSAAALAASRDLGHTSPTLDGWLWWGCKTRPAQASKKELGETLERAFSKYRACVSAVVKGASGDDLVKVTSTLKAQAFEIVALVEPSSHA